MRYVDMHCHCHELEHGYLSKLSKELALVCVSDNLSSSFETLTLAEEYGVTPCIGIHPWEAHNYSVKELESLINEALKKGVKCLGEVGLDKLFYPKTFQHQLELFKTVIKYAREYDLVLNLHTAGTWREVYEILVKNDVKRAYFHWYTGPHHLLEEITGSGYFIGLNPAWKIQDKHRRILDIVPLENVLTESDAPYKYRGLNLDPLMVRETVDYISSKRGISVEEVVEKIWMNFKRIFQY